MSRGPAYRNRNLIIKHIKDWLLQAEIGDKRIVLRTTDDLQERIVLEKVKELGAITKTERGWILEKIF